jgi:hypothetical protein
MVKPRALLAPPEEFARQKNIPGRSTLSQLWENALVTATFSVA